MGTNPLHTVLLEAVAPDADGRFRFLPAPCYLSPTIPEPVGVTVTPGPRAVLDATAALCRDLGLSTAELAVFGPFDRLVRQAPRPGHADLLLAPVGARRTPDGWLVRLEGFAGVAVADVDPRGRLRQVTLYDLRLDMSGNPPLVPRSCDDHHDLREIVHFPHEVPLGREDLFFETATAWPHLSEDAVARLAEEEFRVALNPRLDDPLVTGPRDPLLGQLPLTFTRGSEEGLRRRIEDMLAAYARTGSWITVAAYEDGWRVVERPADAALELGPTLQAALDENAAVYVGWTQTFDDAPPGLCSSYVRDRHVIRIALEEAPSAHARLEARDRLAGLKARIDTRANPDRKSDK